MARESVLNQAEKDSFKIKRFIFHIIRQSELNPIFLDEVVLTKEQMVFFQDRFGEVSQGTQFEFNDKTTSDVYKNCKGIINDPEKNFFEVSRDLTASFKTHHKKKTTNDGVFITSLVSVMDKADLIFLIKLDNRKVYEYLVKDRKAIMQEIKNSFVEDKRAVQKIAIVNVSEYRVWDVLAFDRNPGTGKSITDFFANFLSVHERETPSKLTEKTISEVRKWAINNRDILDTNEETSTYKNRCVDYLKNTSSVKFKDLVDRVTYDENEERRKKLKKSLKSHFEDVGLYGQTYPPNQGTLNKAETKHIRKTAEGVKIEWEGNAKDVNVIIPNTPDANDGYYNISIRTRNVEIIK